MNPSEQRDQNMRQSFDDFVTSLGACLPDPVPASLDPHAFALGDYRARAAVHRAELAAVYGTAARRQVVDVEGAALRWAREQARLSLVEAGAAVGVVAHTVSCWERGVQRPTLGQVHILCDIYGVEPEHVCQAGAVASAAVAA